MTSTNTFLVPHHWELITPESVQHETTYNLQQLAALLEVEGPERCMKACDISVTVWKDIHGNITGFAE